MMSDILNPLTFPLQGSALIQASAGTGKTYTLALLYLRLVLQHGQDEAGDEDASRAFVRHLLPPEILVVTFTNAATQELRDRIRLRLVEMAELLTDPNETLDHPEAEGDAILLKLKQALIQQGRSLDSEARKLTLAAEWMDEASISTIHSWCYRVLTEHAFDSGNGFEQELIQSEADYLQQASEDYWRSFCLALSEADLIALLAVFPHPAGLMDRVKNLLPVLEQLPQSPAGQAGSVDQLFLKLAEEKAQILQPLKQLWQEQDYPTQLEKLFDQAQKEKRLNGQKLRSNLRAGLIAKLRQWVSSEQDRTGIDTGSATFKRMAGVDLSGWKDENDTGAGHEACQALRQLEQQLATIPSPEVPLLEHAAHWIGERVEREKQRRQQWYHNDLLVRLDKALQHPDRGTVLAERIRRKYPVALVDEFQDTDPIQYRIFDRIYQVHQPVEETGFFMIGDPKQAIYAFRGADIYTYLQAGEAAQRAFTLDTNYRSSPALIEQVNRCFMQGKTLPLGTFRLPDAHQGQIDFEPVKAGKTGLRGLVIDTDGSPQDVPAQQAWWIETTAKGQYQQASASIAANEIARLLTLGQAGQATLPDEAATAASDNPRRPVMPRDIAVLVNNGTEARQIEEALYEKGIASVYLSARSSVYGSEAAMNLLLMLRAVAFPLNDTFLRQALASDMLGFSIEALDRLNRDEFYWERQVACFSRLQKVWRYRGVLALIYQLIEAFDIARRLLAQRGGERQLTDLLHLGELLQHASEQVEGELALIRYLEEARLEPDEDNDVQQQRLESDRDLVRIVTVHKSKGLEYPLVFLPFICQFRKEQGRHLPVKTHNDARELQVYLQLTPEIIQAADDERLAEDLRKLYVALTRARYGNWLGLAPLKQLESSAIGYLMQGEDQPVTEASFAQQDWLEPFEPDDTNYHYSPPPSPDLDDARECRIKPVPSWWVASYSAIRYGARSPESGMDSYDMTRTAARDSTPIEEETAAQATAREELGEDAPHLPVEFLTPPLTDQTRSLHQFPAGSRSGTFLHGLLEWAAVQQQVQPGEGGETPELIRGFRAVVQDDALRLEQLHKRCHLRQLSEWVQPLSHWLSDFLSMAWPVHRLLSSSSYTPLPSESESDDRSPSDLVLKDLAPEQIYVEMEFLFQSHHVDSLVLDQLVIDHTLNRAARPMAQKAHLNGLLKGFIDLVVEHEGRYYVIDWKSNKLGDDDTAYHRESMQQAILDKRYDLQYCLYLLALHRQLKARLPDYDYDRHIGGAIYVFLRGNQSPSKGLFMDRPDKVLIEQMDRLFSGLPLSPGDDATGDEMAGEKTALRKTSSETQINTQEVSDD